MVEERVNGTIIESYLVCKRQAWLHLHKITPFQEHPLLELGRIIDEYSYKRSIKRIILENIQIDIVERQDEELLIGEIKKSSKAKDIAKTQLLFYMYTLKKMGVPSTGILMFPKERRREKVLLTKEEEENIEKLVKEISNLANLEQIPQFEKSAFCKNCAYKEFCFV